MHAGRPSQSRLVRACGVVCMWMPAPARRAENSTSSDVSSNGGSGNGCDRGGAHGLSSSVPETPRRDSAAHIQGSSVS